MKVLMGTKNPGKIEGAKKALEQYFNNIEIEGISVESNVSEQPFDEEILLGAKNRVKNLKKYAEENNIDADLYIGTEAGITNLLGGWFNYNLAVIEDKNGLQSIGSSQGFEIPETYIEDIKKTDLGQVMDKVFDKEGLGKGKGGISFLTKDVISRIDITKDAVTMALIKHINGEIWK